MEWGCTFAERPRRAEAASALEKARQFGLSLLVSLLLSLSAGIVVIGVLLVATGVALALGTGGR